MRPHVDAIGGARVLFVMATDHEYGPALQARITPLITGVGPVEAGVATAAALAASDPLPDLVVALGSAGSRRKPLGAVFQVSHVSWRDVDASRLGIPAGQTPFLDLAPVQQMATPLPDWPDATLSTGADVVGGDDYDMIEADLVDMETWAVLRGCQRAGVACAGLRGVSDGPGELTELGGWTDLLPLLDQRLAQAVDALSAALGGPAPSSG